MSKFEWALHCGKKVAIGLVLIGIGKVMISNSEYLLIHTNWEFDIIGAIITIIGWVIVIATTIYFLAGFGKPTPPTTTNVKTDKYDSGKVEEIINEALDNKFREHEGKETEYYDNIGRYKGSSRKK